MRKIYIVLAGLFFVPEGISAQELRLRNQPFDDQKQYHYGISIGMNVQDILLTNNGIESLYATIPGYSPGFSVGLLGDLYLNPFLNLRFSPSLHLGEKSFVFVDGFTDEHYETIVRSSYLSFPLDLKMRALRLNNYRPYLFAGVYGAVDLGRKADEALYLNPFDFGISVGFGIDYYLPIIKVCPELRFSFGMVDIIEHTRVDLTDESLRKYTAAIAQGKTRMISLVFHFD
ncbi:hypothetical protein AGMMS4957_07310 [Bacteroidia bacterium]|nr:hypothetical protein AGMMS4957_07310 [Bacteroidia bacterium]